MKRLLSIVVLLVGMGVNLHAFDIGGRLNLFNLAFGRLALDSNVDVGEGGNISIGGEFFFPFFFLADLTYLTFLGKYDLSEGSQISLQFGRFEFMDQTNHILSHKLDGGRIDLELPFLSAGLAMGYTGLLFNNITYNIVNTKLDDDDVDNDSFFAPKRLIGIADLRLTGLIPFQALYLSSVFNVDLRDEDRLARPGRVEGEIDPEDYGGRLTTHYWTLGIRGAFGRPRSARLIYNFYGTLQLGETLSVVEDATGADIDYRPIRAWLVGGSVGLGLPVASRQFIEGEFLISSGDDDYGDTLEGNGGGDATQFVPISQSTPSFLFSGELGNLGYVLVRYSLLPFVKYRNRTTARFRFFTSAALFFRPTDAPVSIEEDVRSDRLPIPSISEIGANTGRLLLLEGNVGFNWAPFSDLSLTAFISAGPTLYRDSEHPFLVNFALIGTIRF